jgi:outer membrane murein-binding lipoprotein Lpp
MLPNVQHRLDAELFILESLEQLIEQEREMRDTDTESLLARARLVDEFREERASRTTAANQAIAAAERAYAASRYGEALSAYAEAVALIPQDATPAEDIVSNIRTAGAALSDSRAVEAQSEAAREPFGAAREAIAAGSYQQALELLLQVIREYPRSRQMGEVPEAIRTAVRQRAEEVESRIATLEQEVEQLRGRVEAAQSEVAAAQRDAQAAEARAEEAEAQALAAAQAASERREEENAEERAALEEELARLREIEQQYQALTRAYGSYAEREDEILATDAESARLQAKLLLDSFLASRPVQEALPGLRERIRAYDRAFEQAGRENALVDTADIVFELATYADPEAKIGFLEEQQESTDNPNMIDFLDQLEGLIAARR